MNNIRYLGNNIIIENEVLIGNNVTIFDNTIIKSGAIIGDNVTIGYCENNNKEYTVICENVKLRSGCIIYHGCVIAKNSAIGHNTILRDKTIVGENTIIGALVMCEGDTTIGNNVLINAQCHITRFCTIGDYTFFAPNVISTNDNEISYKRKNHGKNLKGFTTEKYVRIAGGVILSPNITLGEGCIVGLGSVVNKDVSPYTLVAGNPTRLIRPLNQKDDIVGKEFI
jgi:UDP-2-acetamido-3-amino-2,3-dideoxy-glucuronate N-acetyltransferase